MASYPYNNEPLATSEMPLTRRAFLGLVLAAPLAGATPVFNLDAPMPRASAIYGDFRIECSTRIASVDADGCATYTLGPKRYYIDGRRVRRETFMEAFVASSANLTICRA